MGHIEWGIGVEQEQEEEEWGSQGETTGPSRLRLECENE